MNEYKKESELIIGKEDIMVKERLAFRVDSPGPKMFALQYPIPVRIAKGRDKEGKITVDLNGANKLTVKINRQLQPGSVHAVELTLLVEPEVETIGTIKTFHWGSMDLYRVITLIQPFQVLGFGQMKIHNRQWQFTNNLSADIRSNFARFRSTRVELGNKQHIRINLSFSIDCSTGGRVRSLRFFGPTSSKRQQTKLLTSGVKTTHDKDGNPVYQISNDIKPGDQAQYSVNWEVMISKGYEPDLSLGSMQALNILIDENPRFEKYLQPSKFWEVDHPDIKKIIAKVDTKPSIFMTHRLLFEFVNRHLKYTITNDRQTAVSALQSGYGDCSEYADLLVTLHRAAGIPSRVVEGIIIENERRKDPEGHAYVEFLTTKGWMGTDPTWGLVLGVSSQHIEFVHQRTESKESKIFTLEYDGPRPAIDHQISWSPVT